MSEQLKPCPFCGCKQIYVDQYNHTAGARWRVVCLGCMATIDPGTCQQKYQAIAAWNLRSQTTEPCDVCRGRDGFYVAHPERKDYGIWASYCPSCGRALPEPPRIDAPVLDAWEQMGMEGTK